MIYDVSSPLFCSFLSEDNRSGSPKSASTNSLSLASRALPSEIVTDIISRLPVTSVLRFQLTHTSWCILLRDPTFIGTHFHQTRTTSPEHFIYETEHRVSGRRTLCSGPISDNQNQQTLFKKSSVNFKIEDCSSGLILLRNMKPKPGAADLYFWNPAIRKVKLLPNYVRSPRDRLAFGFVTNLNDFKVVKMVYSNIFTETDDNSVKMAPEVEVFSFRSNSWRRIRNDISNPCMTLDEIWAFANNSVHWRVIAENAGFAIMAFDLLNEVFQIIRLPSCYDAFFCNFYPKTLDGSLSLVVDLDDHWYVWTMKEYGVSKSWHNIYKVPRSPDLSVVPTDFTRKGYFLVSGQQGLKNSIHVVTKDGFRPMSWHFDGDFGYRRAFLYAESLILLNEGDDVEDHLDLFGRLK